MAKTKNNDKGATGSVDYTGCYGPRISYTELQDFLNDAFVSDNWSEENNPNERFSTCIWGSPGCVVSGTKITVRKVSNDGFIPIHYIGRSKSYGESRNGGEPSITDDENGQRVEIQTLFHFTGLHYKLEIFTPQGWKAIGALVKKFDKRCFFLSTANFELTGAYNHLVQTDKGWKSLEEIKVSDLVITNTGIEHVVKIEEAGIADVYDLEVCSEEHAYYSNGIVSHNTAKTTCAREYSKIPVDWKGKKYAGYNVVYVPLANYEEMGDLLGLPARHVCMTMSKGKEKFEEWVPESCIEGYKSLGWDFLPEKGIRTLCAPPAWVPTEDKPTILILDDWNRASLRIIKGVMQLLQTYGTVTWKLPKGSHIVLTGNPDDQDFQVTTLDKAILTRLRHVTMKFDVKEWSVWAQAQGLDGRGISWCLHQPEMMQGKELTNPRTLSEVFRMTKSLGDLTDKENEKSFRRMASSLLDDETVTSIMLFMQKDCGLVAEPDRVIRGELINGQSVT